MRGTYLETGWLCSSSWKDSNIEWSFGAPLPVLAALLHSLNVTDLRDDGEKDLNNKGEQYQKRIR